MSALDQILKIKDFKFKNNTGQHIALLSSDGVYFLTPFKSKDGLVKIFMAAGSHVYTLEQSGSISIQKFTDTNYVDVQGPYKDVQNTVERLKF